MAKISKHQGASDAAESMVDYEPIPIRREEIRGNGGDESSHGKNSNRSSGSERKSDDSEKVSPQPPVPTTESHSSQTEKAPSAAHSTGGSTRGTQPQPSARKASKKTASKKVARVSSTDDDDPGDDW